MYGATNSLKNDIFFPSKNIDRQIDLKIKTLEISQISILLKILYNILHHPCFIKR